MNLTIGVGDSTLAIDPNAFLQTIDGFGACFNELGWTSLSLLSQEDRDSIFRELYAPGIGANFTINRMPLGSNDFSLDYYSYDDVDGDFDLKHLYGIPVGWGAGSPRASSEVSRAEGLSE